MNLLENDHYNIVNKCVMERISFVWRADNILHYQVSEGAHITMDDINASLEVVRGWGKDNKYLHLFEAGHNSSVDNEVREWAASPDQNQFTVADAILVRDRAQRLIANFYVRFNNPIKPTKVFTSQSEAINWLNEQGSIYSKANPSWHKQTIT
jgi:hypothetical protein